MGKLKTFEQFLTTQGVEIPVFGLIINLILAAVLAFILSWVYARYGNSLSNRRAFARNFVLMTMTTTLIITVVKSSLALSLGLVGALSIVRFRAAIKEPEELSYLFLTIAIGLGLGADQWLITVAAFAVIVGVIWLRHFSRRSEENQNLYITVASQGPRKVELGQIVEILREHCTAVSMKRFDETEDSIEASFLVEFDDFEQLQKTSAALRKQSDSIKMTFMDNKGIFQ